jgi:hypothetical protein
MPGRKMRILGALLAITALHAAPANAQQTPPDDPRVIAVRQAIDQLDDLVQRPPCDQTPETPRRLNAGTPDSGLSNPLISAHRGAITLAPENTLQSYEYAFAFGVDVVEVDIQQASSSPCTTTPSTAQRTAPAASRPSPTMRSARSTPPTTRPGRAAPTTRRRSPRSRRSSSWSSASGARSSSISRARSPRRASSPSSSRATASPRSRSSTPARVREQDDEEDVVGDADRKRLDPLRDREGPGDRLTEAFEDSLGQYDKNYTCPRVRAVA